MSLTWNLYYFSNDQELVKLSCYVEHSFEIITSIKYQSTDETEFNNDGIPNLEIYDCSQLKIISDRR